MNDLIYLAILAGCLAVTLGLVRLCAALMPADQPQQGGKS
jgi:hypothetical protein